MKPKSKEASDNLDIDGEQLYNPLSGQTVGELDSLTPEQLNKLLEVNHDKKVIARKRHCND